MVYSILKDTMTILTVNFKGNKLPILTFFPIFFIIAFDFKLIKFDLQAPYLIIIS